MEMDALTHVRFRAKTLSPGRQKVIVSHLGDDDTRESKYHATRSEFASTPAESSASVT